MPRPRRRRCGRAAGTGRDRLAMLAGSRLPAWSRPARRRRPRTGATPWRAGPGEVEVGPPGTEADHDGDQPDREGEPADRLAGQPGDDTGEGFAEHDDG